MLQEPLMNTALNNQERKLSIPAPQLTNSTPSSSESAPLQEKLQCPRCNSKNTKFCYYNNYNLTQPRHFCKTCRRYWTKGGALRNVPIGGGCRKSKPSSLAHKARPVPASSDDIMPLGLGTHNSHLLDLLKGSSNHFMQNPYNVNLNSFRVVKEEIVDGNYGYQQQMPTSSGVQELYQWPQRSNNYSGQFEKMTGISSGTSTANYNDYCSSLVLTSRGAESIMDQVNPLHNGDLGSWINGAGMTWSDISASNGRFH